MLWLQVMQYISSIPDQNLHEYVISLDHPNPRSSNCTLTDDLTLSGNLNRASTFGKIRGAGLMLAW